MSLDEATQQLISALEPDLVRLAERERQRGHRGERVRYDSASRTATWETNRGDVIGRWYGEVLATYVISDRILRWAWAGRTSLAAPSHADVVALEGQGRGVPQLSMSVVGDLDVGDAATLARLGVLVARGEGLQVESGSIELQFVGLFDSQRPRERDADLTPSRYSFPPPPPLPTGLSASPSSRPSAPPQPPHTQPPLTPRSPHHATSPSTSNPPPPVGYKSLPPIREVYEPRSPTPRSTASAPPPPIDPSQHKIREPARALFVPVATAILNALGGAAAGYQQALFILSVRGDARPDGDAAMQKRRLVVMLVALDGGGLLRAIDASSELVDTAARMVEADRLDGNGPWRKLTARITPKSDGGATFNVDVM